MTKPELIDRITRLESEMKGLDKRRELAVVSNDHFVIGTLQALSVVLSNSINVAYEQLGRLVVAEIVTSKD